MKIAVYSAKPNDREFLEAENHQRNFELQYFENPLTTETVAFTQGFDAVCVFC